MDSTKHNSYMKIKRKEVRSEETFRLEIFK